MTQVETIDPRTKRNSLPDHHKRDSNTLASSLNVI